MKVYQVHEGYINKHGFQHYDLQATYLHLDKALENANKLLEKYKNENPEECDWYTGKDGIRRKTWDVQGWDLVTICLIEEIEVIE
jgi:hypothetical protein